MALMEALLKIKADVQGEGKIGALGNALGGLNDTAKKVSGGLKGALSGLSGIGGVFGALAGAATGAGLVALGKSAIDTADNLRDMSIRTGVSVERLSQLKTAAEMSGATIDDVGKALTKTAIAIGNSTSAASNATATAVAGGTAQLKMSIADQVRLLEQADAQKVATIKSGAERQIQAVRDGEQRQVDAIERAKDQRIAVLERESDQRMREINRRYRQEEKLLNDSFDDRQDAEREQAEGRQRALEREIEKRYELRQKQIKNDKTLNDAAREQLLQQLQEQQGDELDQLRDRFEAQAKARSRYYRDQQEAAQQAIDDRRTAEQEAEKAATEAQKKQLEDRAKAEKAIVAKASAERIAQIKAAAEAQVKAIQDGNKRAQDAYAQLGIALRNADGSQRGAGEVFMDLFDALQKLPTEMERTAALFDIYGKAGPQLAAMFAMPREEVEKLIPTFTTDFANAADNFNDKQVQIGASMGRLGAAIATVLLPAINPLIDAVTGMAEGFTKLPGPLQVLIGSVTALVAAFVLLAPAISAIVSVAGALAGLQLGATIAGWLGAIGPAIAGITALFSGMLAFITGTLIPGLLAFFSGPVGWTVLAVAAVVAMAIAFREPLMQFAAWLWEWGEPIRKFWADLWNSIPKLAQAGMSGLVSGFKAISGLFNTYVTRPISDAWNAVVRALPQAMQSAATFVQRVWTGVISNVQRAVRGMMIFIANAVNSVTGVVNNLIRGFNRLSAVAGGPQLGLIGTVTIPAFAEGGYVNRPTVGLVGEAGSEYIIPASKMQAASERFLSGARGASVIPSTGTKTQSSRTGAPVVNITTGPVMEFNGERYVTMRDLERGMRATAEAVYRQQRTPAARIALGRA
jgi:hypothetical protein